MKQVTKNLIVGFFVGYRKFVIMVLFLAIMVAFRLSELINGAEFAENLQIAVVAFFGTNLGEHVVNLGKEYVSSKNPPKLPPEE